MLHDGSNVSQCAGLVVVIQLYWRFSFPERPGALLSFLSQLESTRVWNCSLFHYRNHGSDIARVLVGLQLEKEDGKPDLFNFLNNLGYTYIDENKNPVYESFLK